MASIVTITTPNNVDFIGAFGLTTNGAPLDLTGSTLFMQVRTAPGDPYPPINLDSASIGGIVIQPPPTGGLIAILIRKSVLRNMKLGTYVHDLVRLRPDGIEEPIWSGSFVLTQGVTLR